MSLYKFHSQVQQYNLLFRVAWKTLLHVGRPGLAEALTPYF